MNSAVAGLYSTEDIKRIVAPIARAYGVGRLSLFGSYARGEATAKSDIDFRLIEKGRIAGYFELAGMFEEASRNSVFKLTGNGDSRTKPLAKPTELFFRKPAAVFAEILGEETHDMVGCQFLWFFNFQFSFKGRIECDEKSRDVLGRTLVEMAAHA